MKKKILFDANAKKEYRKFTSEVRKEFIAHINNLEDKGKYGKITS